MLPYISAACVAMENSDSSVLMRRRALQSRNGSTHFRTRPTARASASRTQAAPPAALRSRAAPAPSFPRTNRTSLVPPLVLIGHAAGLGFHRPGMKRPQASMLPAGRDRVGAAGRDLWRGGGRGARAAGRRGRQARRWRGRRRRGVDGRGGERGGGRAPPPPPPSLPY
jgi:hypothetical protein